jgi:hypothetical protein
MKLQWSMKDREFSHTAAQRCKAGEATLAHMEDWLPITAIAAQCCGVEEAATTNESHSI